MRSRYFIFAFSYIVLVILVSSCGFVGDDDLYIGGSITGEVTAITHSYQDIKVKLYKLEGLGSASDSLSLKADYSFWYWFVVEYGGNFPFPAKRDRIVYLLTPTVETHVYIPVTTEVVFSPASRLVTFESEMPDDTAIRNNNFDTTLR